jgi:hypothetical protein
MNYTSKKKRNARVPTKCMSKGKKSLGEGEPLWRRAQEWQYI